MIGLLPLTFKKIFGIVNAASGLSKGDTKGDRSRGWGDKFAWSSLEEAEVESNKTNKPVMVIVFNPSCGDCVTLRQSFAQNKTAIGLCQNMIMVNCLKEDIVDYIGKASSRLPDVEKVFYPDGVYVPRVMFFRPAWKFIPEVKSDEDKEHAYLYNTDHRMAESMKKVCQMK